DVLQPCVTFNKKNTYQWYQQRIHKLEEEPGYDPSNKLTALEAALAWADRIHIGLYFKEERPTYEDRLPQLNDLPLVKQPIEDVEVEKLLDRLR
ncbi:MAG: 2-oxoacid ferredoxin oxidoreductase, partial [Candidatus Gracilibacteria bacterium]